MTPYAPRLILVPTDFSANAQHALETAASVARTFGATTHVLHVYHLPQHPLAEGLPMLPHDMLLDLDRQLRASVEEHAASLRAAGVTCEPFVAPGDPSVEILRHAALHGPGMIVMGTHGRTGIKHVVLGSVAERVVRRAHCPVLVVPAPASEA
jgi:nucleotide-binding universal stress UspA family protein